MFRIMLLFVGLLPSVLLWAQRNRTGVDADWETDMSKKNKVTEYEFEAYMPKQSFKTINFPSFVNNERAKQSYKPEEAAVVVSVGNEHKAYSLDLLMYHPVINDRIGGIPIAVTYCPLTDAVNVWKRSFMYRNMVREVDFKVSGLLRNSNTVLYDRFTESWWQQFTGTAMIGEFAGVQLERVYSLRMTMKQFWDSHRYGLTINPNVKQPDLPYGISPYYKYDQTYREKPIFLRKTPQSTLMAMERVVGVEIMDKHIVYPYEEVRKAGVLNDKPLDMYVVVFWQEGITSALDTKTILEGKPVGSLAVYSSFVDGRLLTFIKEGMVYRDEETSSVWTFEGACIEGELKGQQLKPLNFVSSFSFAQTVFYPDNLIYSVNW